MENNDIPDGNIKASSTSDPDINQPFNARLNGLSCWAGLKGEISPWIQADIGYQTSVSGVVTQGGGGTGNNLHWVTSFNVSTFSMSVSDTEVFIKNEDGTPIVSKRTNKTNS